MSAIEIQVLSKGFVENHSGSSRGGVLPIDMSKKSAA